MKFIENGMRKDEVRHLKTQVQPLGTFAYEEGADRKTR